MSIHNTEQTHDTDDRHDAFIWSGYIPMAAAIVLGLALAAMRLVPILAAPIEWSF